MSLFHQLCVRSFSIKFFDFPVEIKLVWYLLFSFRLIHLDISHFITHNLVDQFWSLFVFVSNGCDLNQFSSIIYSTLIHKSKWPQRPEDAIASCDTSNNTCLHPSGKLVWSYNTDCLTLVTWRGKPFENQNIWHHTNFNLLNTNHVQYSDPHGSTYLNVLQNLIWPLIISSQKSVWWRERKRERGQLLSIFFVRVANEVTFSLF